MITFSIKMRKLFFALIPLLLATVSCNSDSGNYDPVGLPAYTVMIYAQGGGLDNFLFETVKDLYNYGSTDNVNVTGYAPATGKVEVTVTPKTANPTAFFYQIELKK